MMNLRVRARALPSVCLAAAFLFAFAALAAPVYAASAVDFDALRGDAPDAVAWVQLADTRLNYPVVRGADNDFYLGHLPNGEESELGSIFMDFRNQPDFSDANTIIHGHSMRSGVMFGMLKNYVMQEYYDRHPVVQIFTPQGGVRNVELLAGYVFDQASESLPVGFSGADDFNQFVQSAKARSMFQSGVEASPGDRLVTFATCDFDYNDGRIAVIGKLVD